MIGGLFSNLIPADAVVQQGRLCGIFGLRARSGVQPADSGV